MVKRLRLVALIMSRVVSVLGCVRLFFFEVSQFGLIRRAFLIPQKKKTGTGAKQDFKDIDPCLKLHNHKTTVIRFLLE